MNPENCKRGNYAFQNASESHGTAFQVNMSPPPMAGFYDGNEGVQIDGCIPNKRPRTIRYNPSSIEPDTVASMEAHQQESIMRIGGHNNSNHSNKGPENNLSDYLFMNNGMGAPPWLTGILEETISLPNEQTQREAQAQPELAPTTTSSLVDDSPFSQSLSYLDPNPIFVPPMVSCNGTKNQPVGQLESVVVATTALAQAESVIDTTSKSNYPAPPNLSSFVVTRNDFGHIDISPDERRISSGIEYGLDQRSWETHFGNFSPHSHPGAPKQSGEAVHHLSRLGARVVGSYNKGPPALTDTLLYHPTVNDDAQQQRPYPFTTVNHQTLTDPVAHPANMITGPGAVPSGAPMMSPVPLQVNPQQLVQVQQVVQLNFQNVAQYHHSPNPMPTILVDQWTSRSNANNPFVSSTYGNPTVQEQGSSSSQAGLDDQQPNMAVADKKKTPHHKGIPLSLQGDHTRLSGYQTLVRQQLEFFVADLEDIQSGGQGRKKKLWIGQVGIRCIHCRHLPWGSRGHAAVYYPSTLEGVYQAAQNMASNHLCGSCHCIPATLQEKLRSLRKENASKSVRHGKIYWAEACRAVGVVETTKNGLRLKQIRTHNKEQTQKEDMVVEKSQP